jgi:energy-coupling factor transporter ATP-binding protein EcfA2
MQEKNLNFYHYLEDNEIDFTDDQDLIGTNIYVNILRDIIVKTSDNNTTETIAIVGQWGSGKSSIIKSLESVFNNTGQEINEKPVKFYFYNAWKYNNDSFRRTFLINCAEDEKSRKQIENRLYQTNTETFYKMNLSYFARLIFTIAIVGFGSFVIWKFVNEYVLDIPSFSSHVGSDIIYPALITWIITAFLQPVIVERRISTIKEFSPQDFSNQFNRIVSSNEKFSIYVIDDIDRCTDKQVLEILETIHGFLKNQSPGTSGETNKVLSIVKRVHHAVMNLCKIIGFENQKAKPQQKSNYVFLIPIDTERIYSVLTKERGYTSDDNDEYFNKLFDVILRIDVPEKSNLFNMIDGINKNNHFGYSNIAMSLISDCLVSTPREIKRHLNELNLLRSIIVSKKKAKFIKDEALVDTNQIVKLYILKKRWPMEYRLLLETSFFDNSVLRNYVDKKADSMSLEMQGDTENLTLKKREFINFIRTSSFISIRDIYTFEYLKDTEMDLNRDVIMTIISDNGISDLEEHYKSAIRIEDMIVNLTYAFRKYIRERNLAITYGLNIFNVYIWLLTACSDYVQEDALINNINVEELMDSVRATLSSNMLAKEKRIDESIKLISNIISLKRDNKNVLLIEKNFSDIAIGAKSFSALYSMLETDKKTNFYTAERRKEFINLLITSWKPDYDEKLAKLLENNSTFDFILNPQNINIFVEDEARHMLSLTSLKSPSLLKDKYPEIIDGLQLFEIFRRKQHQDPTFAEEIDALTYLQTFCHEEFYEYLDSNIQANDISTYISTAYNQHTNEYLENVLELLIKLFLNNLASLKPNTRKVQIAIFNSLQAKYLPIFYSVLNKSDLPDNMKVDYLLDRLSKTNYSQEAAVDLLNMINTTEDENAKNSIYKTLEEIYPSGSNKHLTGLGTTIHFNYQGYIQSFFPYCIQLSPERLVEFFNFTPLQIILRPGPVLDSIKNKKIKGQEVYRALIGKISTVDEYKMLKSIITSSAYRAEFNQALYRLIDLFRNHINILKEICHLSDINKTASNKLKRIQSQEFPNDPFELW